MEPTNDAGRAGPPTDVQAVQEAHAAQLAQVEPTPAAPVVSTAPTAAGMARGALTALYEIRIHTVFVLVAASLGLGLCAVQIETGWVVGLFAVVWGVTVIAMIALAARMLEERSGKGRHRRVTQS
ncbi:hypothetical protein [Kitasatospora mediocidica]|uniref:hypothetical protein n=1 Tax=Kitasatospora mediocidica TaxID=58352 RepID=UPI0012FAE028|nr:hypothetical protein [Kitasatospora mediocidica]